MKREQRSEKIKDKILDTLLELYSDKTFYKMTSDEISKTAGVSKRTLYKYFPSKEEMYLEMVLKCFNKLNAHMKKAADSSQGTPAKESIMALGRAYLEFSLSSVDMSRVVSEFDQKKYEDKFPELVRKIDRTANEFELAGYVAGFYEEKGASCDVDINSVAVFLWAQLKGLSDLMSVKSMWIKDHYGISSEKLIEDSLVLSGLLLERSIK